MQATRDILIETMKGLLWQRGYDATSPNQVLEKSGVGKGSLYHHFKSKKALAIAAMDSRAEQLIKEADGIFKRDISWLDKFHQYLFVPRNGLKGCRLGRISHDPSIAEDSELHRPIARYFTHLQHLMEQTLSEAKEQGRLSAEASPAQLAFAVIAGVQGGFVVSRGSNNKNALGESMQGIYALLQAVST